jgi:hypothetical protein
MDVKAERIRELLQDISARNGTTFADLTAVVNPTPGGRFASREAPATIVKGGPDYPRQPASSYWHTDVVGPEPSLGFSINDMPAPEGFNPPEIVAAQDVEPSSAVECRGTTRQDGVLPKTFRRRF